MNVALAAEYNHKNTSGIFIFRFIEGLNPWKLKTTVVLLLNSDGVPFR